MINCKIFIGDITFICIEIFIGNIFLKSRLPDMLFNSVNYMIVFYVLIKPF